MTSAQEAGTLTVSVEAPSGARRLVKAASSYWWSPGGAADGVVANTPEKWNYLPLSPHRGAGGYSIVFEFTAFGLLLGRLKAFFVDSKSLPELILSVCSIPILQVTFCFLILIPMLYLESFNQFGCFKLFKHVIFQL